MKSLVLASIVGNLIGSLLVTNFASAADSLSTKIHNQYTSFRALGMGNAFTAVADDYSLMFYNPAGFAKKRYNEVQFSLVGVGYSPKTITLMDEIKKATETGTDSQKAQAVSNVLEQYYGKSLGGSVQAVELFWTRRNWGVALLPAQLTVDMSFNRQLGPAIDLNVIGDTTIAYGYGADINKFVSAGITAKYIHRVSIDQSFSALEIAEDSNILSTKRFKEGTAIDFDLGMMWTPNWFGQRPGPTVTKVVEVTPEALPEPLPDNSAEKLKELSNEELRKADEIRAPQAEGAATAVATASGDTTLPAANVNVTPAAAISSSGDASAAAPVAEAKPQKKVKKEVKVIQENPMVDDLPLTFGLVVKNVVGGNFSQSKIINKDATEVPTSMHRTVDVGSQYEFAKFGNLTMRAMIDFKDMLHPDISLTKASHFGVEFDYYPNSWFKSQIRGGLNQMYYTAGVTFLFGVLHIDAVSYGEEVGTTTTKIENRVYAAKVGFNF